MGPFEKLKRILGRIYTIEIARSNDSRVKFLKG